MDITPIHSGIQALSGGTIAFLASLLIIPIVVCYLVLTKSKNDFRIPTAIMLGLTGIVGIVSAGAIISEAKESSRSDAVKSYVSSLGFEIKDGAVAVNPGTDKVMTVSKNGEEYKCTSYAPDSVDEKIFLVCDTAMRVGKGSIEDLSMQLNGMKIRDDAMESQKK